MKDSNALRTSVLPSRKPYLSELSLTAVKKKRVKARTSGLSVGPWPCSLPPAQSRGPGQQAPRVGGNG